MPNVEVGFLISKGPHPPDETLIPGPSEDREEFFRVAQIVANYFKCQVMVWERDTAGARPWKYIDMRFPEY